MLTIFTEVNYEYLNEDANLLSGAEFVDADSDDEKVFIRSRGEIYIDVQK